MVKANIAIYLNADDVGYDGGSTWSLTMAR